MADENQKLMEQISLLAGQINRAKNQQNGGSSTPSTVHGPSRYQGRGGHYNAYNPYPASGRGGYRVGKPPVHRHRTLVLNGASANNPSSDDASSPDAYSPSWVTRNDRHLQLINSSVYQEQTEARNKAIEQTRQQKLAHNENMERAQFMNHLKRAGNPSVLSNKPNDSVPTYEIVVDGIKFAVVKNGSKLVKLPGDQNAPKATPKVATVGGVKFYRTKNGNMYRQAIVKAQRRSGAVKKVNVPCRNFSLTGSCPKGPMCRYTHNPAKVAACKEFLLKGTCVSGDQCDMSHDLIPERTPHCVHYAKGNCFKPDCAYTHRVLPAGASVCRDFGFYGYCDKGISCPDRHAFECPDFSNNGNCANPGCKLPHIERASVLRKASAAQENLEKGGDDGDDLSSDDDASVDSGGVDSDEVDEFVGGGDDSADSDEELDFIKL